MLKMSRDPLLRRSFLVFCDTKGEEYIGALKTHDKQGLLQTMSKYREMCLDETVKKVVEEPEESYESQQVEVENVKS